MTFLKKIRLKKEINQETVAKKIGVSRTTYIQIEKGERELKVSEAKKLANYFGISIEDFLEGRDVKEPEVRFTKEDSSKKREKEDESIRISVPQNRVDKFKEVLLYVLESIGARSNVGDAVICKLMYFIDFDYYEKYEEQLMGVTYLKNHHGPTPAGFTQIIKEMEKDGDIVRTSKKYFQYDQKKYMPRRSPDLSVLSAQEKELIDSEIERFKDFNATQMAEYSHKDIPWITAENLKAIDYESVFYRTPEFSRRQYEDKV
jgi:transcriptional regulator with XRE-family HTH domain